MKTSPAIKRKPVESPPRAARVLKLVDDEEDLKAQQPLKVTLGPVPTALTPSEESDVKVIEAPLVKKRKLVKGVEVAIPSIDEAQNVANILAA